MSKRYSESVEQQGLLARARLRRYLDSTLDEYLFAIPNAGTGGGRRAMLAGVRRKAEGVVSGVPDLFCHVPKAEHHGLFIEMKREDGVPSDVSATQKIVMDRLTRCGYKCVVAFGADEAWHQLCDYLSIQV